jgi:GntR family transcriptional regulator, transcriptional repressor for pyruvate dehydrogenase complex
MERLKKVNLSEAVYQRLITMIQEGEVKPGDKLPTEPELCKLLGASRTVIREAIKRLAEINVLSIIHGSGTFVSTDPDILVNGSSLNITLDREMVDSIYEVRSILDTGIARYAAIKATKKDIESIKKALEKMRRALATIDPDLSIEGDEEFHLALCEASHNQLLQKIAWPIINHGMLRSWKYKKKPSRALTRAALEGHERIAEAIGRKDPETAVAEMEKHLKTVFDRVYRS